MKRRTVYRRSRFIPKSLFGKILLLLVLIPFLIGGVFVARVVKDKLTAHPTYKVVQESEYVPVADKAKTSDLVIPGPKAILPGAKWVPQTFNNCAPATTSMLLQHFGYSVGQDVTKAALRTNPDDKDVFTHEIQAYIKKEFGIESKLSYNGNLDLVKKLIANGFYVFVEDWLHPNEDIGHDTIITGYDDEQGVLIFDDSYIGVNIVFKYDVFDGSMWKAFNREYLIAYRPEQEEKLKAIIGEDWDTKTMYQNAVKRAQAEIAENDRDMYAYFNLGTSYYALGEYQNAQDAFEKAKAIGWPRRMLWYQIQPVQTLNELGRYQEAIALADTGLWANDSFAELHVEKARAYKGLGDTQKAREEVQKALQYAPNLQSAKDLNANL